MNWNGWEDSIECMESLLRSDHRDFEIILVDNCSSDGSVEKIEAWAEGSIRARPSPPLAEPSCITRARVMPIRYAEYSAADVARAATRRTGPDAVGRGGGDEVRPTLSIIRAASNGGFGAGNNLAFAFIRARGDADWIWLLNNDTVVTPSTLRTMLRRAGEGEAIVGGILRYYHEPERLQAVGGSRLSRLSGRVRTVTRPGSGMLDYVNGACLLMSSRVMEAVGDFDEKIFMYFEEVDYCLRAAANGYPCVASDAVVFHKHGGSRKDGDDSFAWEQVLRNKRYVLRKNLGLGPWLPIHHGSVVLFALGLASPGKRRAARKILSDWWVGPFRSKNPLR